MSMKKAKAMPARRENRYANIHDAVKHGDVGELEAMVKEGASINEVDAAKDRFTPLHWACYHGALECCHWLLWHGADTTVTTPKGWTPAHIAAIRGQDACMQALANNGANLNAKDMRGATPAHMAASHGNSFTLHSMLRSGIEVNAVDRNGWSPVHCSAFHGRLGCLQLIIRWGGGMDSTDNQGNTPAHLSAMEGHLHCLKFLVGEGPNPTHILAARNDNGETPKMLAQQFYKDNIVEYIENIEWERDHPEESENLAFPAHVAAYTGDLTHLRMLIENGVVNVNERDDKGSTPAHKAAGQGYVDLLEWLIEVGANMTITNNAGESPKDVARRFAQLAVVKLLGGEDDEIEEDVSDDEDVQPALKDKSRSKSRRSRSRSAARRGQDAEDDEGLLGESGEGESDDGLSPPPAGNTEGEGLVMNKQQQKQARDEESDSDEIENDGEEEVAPPRFRPPSGRLGPGGCRPGSRASIRPGSARPGSTRPGSSRRGSQVPEDKDSIGRARKKVEELERLLEVAKKNYSQLGGKILEDRRRLKHDLDSKRTINELEAQLDYERLRREKLEAQLDEYRREIAYLTSRLEEAEGDHLRGDRDEERTEPRGRKKKVVKKKQLSKEGGVFIRRNVSVPRNTKIV